MDGLIIKDGKVIARIYGLVSEEKLCLAEGETWLEHPDISKIDNGDPAPTTRLSLQQTFARHMLKTGVLAPNDIPAHDLAIIQKFGEPTK